MDKVTVNLSPPGAQKFSFPELKQIIFGVLSADIKESYNFDADLSNHLLLKVSADAKVDITGSKSQNAKWHNKAFEIKATDEFDIPSDLTIVIFPKDLLASQQNKKGGNCIDDRAVKKIAVGNIVGKEYQNLLKSRSLSPCFKGLCIYYIYYIIYSRTVIIPLLMET